MLKKYLDIKYTKAVIREYFEDKSNLYTTIALVLFLIGWGGYKAYNYYNVQVQTKAQVQFSEALEVYNKALAMQLLGMNSSDKSYSEWDDAELAFRVGHEQNKSSGIAPFFLVYQAQSLAKKGDYQQALTMLDEAQKGFSLDHWRYLLKITRALILFNVEQSSAL